MDIWLIVKSRHKTIKTKDQLELAVNVSVALSIDLDSIHWMEKKSSEFLLLSAIFQI